MTRKLFYKALGMLAVLVTAGLLHGCMDDGNLDPCPTGADHELMFTLSVPPVNVGTRGLSTSQEDALDKVDVLVFDNNGTKYAYRTYGTVDPEGNGNLSRVRVKVLPTGTDKHNYVILGNLSDEVEALLPYNNHSAFIGEDKQTLLDKILVKAYSDSETDSKKRHWDTATPRYLPMWGDNGEVYSINTSNDIETINKQQNEVIKMLRAVARIDVNFDPDTKDDFLLTKIMVLNAPETGYAAPWKTNLNTTTMVAQKPTVITNGPTNDILYEINSRTVSDTDRSFGLTRTIYVNEHLNKIDNANALPQSQRLAIIIGGIYDKTGQGDFSTADETWYRLDLYHKEDYTDPVEKQKILDVLRNHLYRLTITNIGGMGYPDPDTAVDSDAINMDIDVVDWENIEPDDIWSDGHTQYGVTPRKISVSKWGVEDQEIIAFTNHSGYPFITYDYEKISDEYVYDAIGLNTASNYSFIDKTTISWTGPTSTTINNLPATEAKLTFSVGEYRNLDDPITPRKMRIVIKFYDKDPSDPKAKLWDVVPVDIEQEATGAWVQDFFYVYDESDPLNSSYATRSVYLFAKGQFTHMQVRAMLSGYEAAPLNWQAHKVETATIHPGENPWRAKYDKGDGKENEYSSVQLKLPINGINNYYTYDQRPLGYNLTAICIDSRTGYYRYRFQYSLDGGNTWLEMPQGNYNNVSGFARDEFENSYIFFNILPLNYDPNTFAPYSNIPKDGGNWEIYVSGQWENDTNKPIFATVDASDPDNLQILGTNTLNSPGGSTVAHHQILSVPIPKNEESTPRKVDLYFSIDGTMNDLRPFEQELVDTRISGYFDKPAYSSLMQD